MTSEATGISELATQLKSSRDHWTITWSDGHTFEYYGNYPDKCARRTKEFAWGMTYTVTKN